MALTKAQLVDLNANELIVDLDADTSITADTDDQIDIKIAGADDFRFTANTFTALSGSSIVTPTLTVSSSATISGGAINVAAIDLDGATDIGAALADADLFLIDDGAGGTNRKTAASRIKTYVADVTLTTAAQTNITSLGTLTALTVDDITIDGSTISDSGDFTIDGGADIILDADGADIILKDGGTTFASLTNSSGELVIKSGSTPTTAATFSGANVTLAGTVGSGAITSTGAVTGTSVVVSDDGNIGSASDTDALAISSGGVVTFSQKPVINSGVAIDNITIDGTEIDLSSGDLTVDVAGDITLDADGADINLADGGTTFGTFTNSSSDFVIDAAVQDKDIIFKGDDGGSAITSLTLDMSNAGAAIFSAAAYNAEATLTDASTISWNAIPQPVAKVTLGANRSLGAASGGVAGAFISLLIIQDGTGSRTVSFNAAYEFAEDTAPTLTTTASKGDLFVFRYNGSKWLEVGRNLNLTLS